VLWALRTKRPEHAHHVLPDKPADESVGHA
jgi:hypothetical protein